MTEPCAWVVLPFVALLTRPLEEQGLRKKICSKSPCKITCARGRVRDDGALCLGSFPLLGLSHEASLLPLPGAGHGQRKCAEDQRRRWQVERNLQIPHFLFRRVDHKKTEVALACQPFLAQIFLSLVWQRYAFSNAPCCLQRCLQSMATSKCNTPPRWLCSETLISPLFLIS